MNEQEKTVIKAFSATMRQVNLQGLQAMQDAKRALVATGMSPGKASDLLASTLRVLGEESRQEPLQ